MPDGRTINNIQRFKPGMLPPEGRLTSPVGTYYNNPSTAADGFLGAQDGPFNTAPMTFSDFTPGSITPPQLPGVDLSGVPRPYQNIAGAVTRSLARDTMFNQSGTPISNPGIVNPIAYDANGIKYEWNSATGKYERPSAGAFTPSSAEPNPLVGGQDLGASPPTVSVDMLRSIFPGRTQAEINQIMSSMGYVPHIRNGQVTSFLRTQAANNANQPGGQSMVDERGRPQWLSASEAGSLAPGETVDTQNAVFRGGTPTTQDVGSTPAGTSQYSVTVKQNLDKKLEKEGAYVWKKYTKKDENGNWVAYYVKELRKVYGGHAQAVQEMDRAAREKAAAEADAASRAKTTAENLKAAPEDNNALFTQLVNLRVNYG